MTGQLDGSACQTASKKMTADLASFTAAENKSLPFARFALQGLLRSPRRIPDGEAEAAEDQDDVHFRWDLARIHYLPDHPLVSLDPGQSCTVPF